MKKLLLLFAVLATALTASAENYILYTTTDGQIVSPTETDFQGELNFGANIVSNTYENGQGKLVFDGEVTKIGRNAFYQCNTLESIEIPSSVTLLEGSSFYYFQSLKKVVFNAINCADHFEKYLSGPFANCSNLTEFIIGDKVTRIPYQLCQETNISNIDIPASVKDIGSNAFTSCFSLESITIPEGVEKLGDAAFSSCYALKTVKFNATNCEVYRMEDSQFDFFWGPFCFGSENVSVEFGENVKRIPTLYLKHPDKYILELPAQFTIFDEGAYGYCSDVAVIRPKAAVPPTIQPNSFSGLNPEKCVVQVPEEMQAAYRSAPVWCNMQVMGLEELEAVVNGNRYLITSFPAKTCVLLKAEQQPAGEVTIPACANINGTEYAVMGIGDEAFLNCDQITKVNLPDNIESIGTTAFSGCTALKSIDLPESIKTIGDFAFGGTGIEEITIPEGVISIGHGCFGYSELTTLHFNACEMSASSNKPFAQASKLTNAYIGKKVKSLYGIFSESTVKNVYFAEDGELELFYYDDFKNCELNEFKLPLSVKTYYWHPFSNTKFETLIIPNGVSEIDFNAFDNCSVKNLRYYSAKDVYKLESWGTPWIYDDLETLYLGKEVAEIPEFILKFLESSALTYMEIEEGNPSFASENGILYNADKSEILHIFGTPEEFYSPENLKEIKEYQFYRAPALKKVVLRNVTAIGEAAFKSCDNLETVVLGENMQTIGDGAFDQGRRANTQTAMYSLNPVPPVLEGSGTIISSNASNNATLYVPAAALDAYKNDAYWSQFQNIVPLTDEEMQAAAIHGVTIHRPSITNKAYNLQGQPVTDDYKGIVIKNGRKVLVK